MDKRLRILYVSVHQVLEYDEIRLFHSMGHYVFPLGVYFAGMRQEAFRPELALGSDLASDVARFAEAGGKYQYGASAQSQIIPESFVRSFDVCIVMHDPDFFAAHWPVISNIPVIWRTIGVNTLMLENVMRPYRDAGCKIVRYCPTEQLANNYLGHDAIIRFPKIISDFAEWQGDERRVLLFSHDYKRRFKQEFEFFIQATSGLPYMIGGALNEELEGAAGILTFEEQNSLLQRSQAYFYAAGSFIPYTLNFMEAWLSGIPVVAVDCRALFPDYQCQFAEVPLLIESGTNGFLVSTPEEAHGVLQQLMSDKDLARRVGSAGRRRAQELFSSGPIIDQWAKLFSTL
jgi:hypothetical protein